MRINKGQIYKDPLDGEVILILERERPTLFKFAFIKQRFEYNWSRPNIISSHTLRNYIRLA